MSEQPTNTSLRNFLIIWLGQLVSGIGSQMTGIALEIWAWETTGQATTLALVGFFGLLPSIIITPISGIIVDRYNRKLLMMFGDTVAVLATITLLFLYINNLLQIWHLYVAAAFVGTFSQFQYLAYSASVSLMIPKQHYTRASSLEFLSHHSAIIIAPALAGYFYQVIGLFGIWLIDISTFIVAISTILFIPILQPSQTAEKQEDFWQNLGYGVRYLTAHKSLLLLLVINLLFFFAHDLGGSLYIPMILARTGNDTLVLGNLITAAGFGGVLGALIVNKWGGFKDKIRGILLGMMGVGLTKIVFGLGRTLWVWIPPQFLCSLSFTAGGSADNAIWLAKVAPNVQGRVFAARSLLLQLASAVAVLVAGPLADKVFIPAFSQEGSMVSNLGGIFGAGTAGGLAMLYVICAVCMFLVGLAGFSVPLLRNLEKILPDYEEKVSAE
ncbi:MFS transporter [Nostoc sp. FACHB-87]|uniref:MFS transporter n=1 Tax=Nostocaceae TaxID=1162 RepID=UPI001684B086|nr:MULTISPECIES: MFS transporter [Nostocaceae]MBD2453038.1 MFS transporter [Nostoc sp. FACHB-87]MBD2475184.1 MFS transporter [Anabaena sp. FACHB-83]